MGPICNALQIMHSKHMKKTNENTEENIDSIIRKHPLTCNCYYRNKFNALLKFLKKKDHFFGHDIDCFFDTKFQNKGNEHDHGILWIENAPIYGQDPTTAIEKFIHTYIYCDSTLIYEELKKIQTHPHTKTCKKYTNST